MKCIMCIVTVCLLSISVVDASYTHGFVDLDNLQDLAGDWLNPADMEDFALLASVWYTDQTPPTPDHHWPFEDVSGTEVNDIIGYEKLVETAGFIIADANILAREGYGIKFGGDNDGRITHPTLLDDLAPTDSITIMMWARPMSDNETITTGGGLFQKQNLDPSDSLSLDAGKDSTYQARLRNNANDGEIDEEDVTLDSGVPVEVDVWRHVAFVWTPTDASLYIDGQLTVTVDQGTCGPGSDRDMMVGSNNHNIYGITYCPFGGMIDDFRIYKSALTAAQIANVYDLFPPVTMYTLTVTDSAGGSGATGGGDFLNEQSVTITAGTPTPGYVFIEWTGDTEYVSDTSAVSTTVTMPAANIAVEASYGIDSTNQLTVNNGTGSGDYIEGASVPIEADTPDANDIFIGWTGDTEYLADPSAASTTVSMPAVDVTVTAQIVNKTTQLKVHWPMEETSGTTSDNVIGDGNDLTAINGFDIATDTRPGRVGNGFGGFEADDDSLECTGLAGGQPASILDVFPNQVTVMGWLKPGTGNSRGSWFAKRPQTWYGLYLGVDDTTFIVETMPNDAGKWIRITSDPIVPDSWYHYAMTWVSNDMRLYVDGVQTGTTYTGWDIADFPDCTGPGTNVYDLTLGNAWAHTYPYIGLMDEVKIFEAALSPQQILEEYEATPAEPMYVLTVTDVNGIGSTGSGSFLGGSINPIAAGTPNAGYEWGHWAGDTQHLTDSIYYSSNAVFMPGEAVTVTAVYYQPSAYETLTMVNATATVDGAEHVSGNTLHQGAYVEIEADAALDANDIFTHWTSNNGVVFADPNSTTTTFMMPGTATTITANYADKLGTYKVHWAMENTSGSDVNNVVTQNGLDPGWSHLTAFQRYETDSTFDISTQWTAGGKVGNAYNFFDNNEWGCLQCRGLADNNPPVILDIFPHEVTISGWLKQSSVNDADGNWFGHKASSTYGLYLTAGSSANRVYCSMNSTSQPGAVRIQGLVDPAVDTWYHYAFTWEGSNMKLYIDGVQDGSTYTGLDIDDFIDMTPGIGSYYGPELGTRWAHLSAFDGVIDEVKIWEAALTAEQIATEYASY